MFYVLAGFYGLMIGNYLTSAYFRIPRFIPINGINSQMGKAPHCSVCNHKLEFYEYFPILNWFSTWFKCNYCKAPIDPIYIILEISMTAIGALLFKFLGLTPKYVMAVLLAGTLLLNFSLLARYQKLYPKSVFSLLVTGSIFLFI
ncbi:MAG: prepilin peptidase [Rickettsiales bacterium]|jgi:leader peptidase (prepilin peptidase)/N-methyltransferase|nr:prepilin peptidase [Rickettsiales bacterium]